jgi:predicted anti-sigma-YlaC factor YlaD
MTAGGGSLTCREANDFLAAYVAGELNGRQRALFDAHLAECPDCVVFLGQYAATIDLAKEACGDDDEPAVLPERLVRAILAARETPAAEAPPPRRPRRR